MKIRLDFGTEKFVPDFRDNCGGLHLKYRHLLCGWMALPNSTAPSEDSHEPLVVRVMK